MVRLLVAAASTGVAAGALTMVVPVAIWPGEATLTAPLFCSPVTEPMVVSDTTHDSEGTSVNYTLYCVGERGAITDGGFALPMLALFGAHAVLLTTLVLLTKLWRRSRPDPATQSPVGPIEY